MEDTKLCPRQLPSREAGIVYWSGNHQLQVFDNIELDESLIFLSADKSQESFEALKAKMLDPREQLSEYYGAMYIAKKDIQTIKNLLNETCQEYLSENMRAYKRSNFAALFGIRYFEAQDAVLFMYSNSRVLAHTFLDPIDRLTSFFQTKHFPSESLVYFRSNYSTFTSSLELSTFITTGELSGLPRRLEQDQLNRNTQRKALEEKDMLREQLGSLECKSKLSPNFHKI